MTSKRRNDIFAFIVCLCAIIVTAGSIWVTIKRQVQVPTQQAVQAKQEASKASKVAAKAESHVKQVTQQVQQNQADAQKAVIDAQKTALEAKLLATRVIVHNAKECGKQITLTNIEVARLRARTEALEAQMKILRGEP